MSAKEFLKPPNLIKEMFQKWKLDMYAKEFLQGKG
jgi:hypothetical protein